MKITVLPKAIKSLSKISPEIQKKIIKRIDKLADNPLPRDVKKLTNQPGYRIRIGGWRVLYIIDSRNQTLIVARIAHRREVYR